DSARSDADAVGHTGRFPQRLVAARRTAAREGVVDEHHTMRDKAIGTDRHAFAQEGMRLNPAASADLHASLNFDERPDHHLIADLTAIEVHRLMHDDVFPKHDIADAALSYGRTAHLNRVPSRIARRSTQSPAPFGFRLLR